MDVSENELDYVRRRNANRPSVIYFHGPWNCEKSMEISNARDILTKSGGGVKRCLNVRDEDYTSKDERIAEEVDSTICSRDIDCLDGDGEDCLRKRHRTSFTSFQLKRLEEAYEQDCYIVGMKRWRLSEELEIPEKQIKIWFQNKRTKMRNIVQMAPHKSRDTRARII